MNNDVKTYISEDYYNYLITGKWKKDKYLSKKGYPKKYRIEYTILFRLISRGLTKENILKIFQESYKGSYFHQRPEWFGKAYNRALLYYKTYRDYDFDIICDKMLEKCKYLPFTPSTRITFEYIIKTCKKVGVFDNIYLSVKRISEETNQHFQYVMDQMKIFTDNGFMERIKKAVPGKLFAKYNICAKKIYADIIQAEQKGIIPSSNSVNHNTSNLSVEQLDTKKIGKNGKIIYDFIIENYPNGVTQEDVNHNLKISYPTIIKKLKMLTEENLIEVTKKDKKTKKVMVFHPKVLNN